MDEIEGEMALASWGEDGGSWIESKESQFEDLVVGRSLSFLSRLSTFSESGRIRGRVRIGSGEV